MLPARPPHFNSVAVLLPCTPHSAKPLDTSKEIPMEVEKRHWRKGFYPSTDGNNGGGGLGPSLSCTAIGTHHSDSAAAAGGDGETGGGGARQPLLPKAPSLGRAPSSSEPQPPLAGGSSSSRRLSRTKSSPITLTPDSSFRGGSLLSASFKQDA